MICVVAGVEAGSPPAGLGVVQVRGGGWGWGGDSQCRWGARAGLGMHRGDAAPQDILLGRLWV